MESYRPVRVVLAHRSVDIKPIGEFDVNSDFVAMVQILSKLSLNRTVVNDMVIQMLGNRQRINLQASLQLRFGEDRLIMYAIVSSVSLLCFLLLT